jgi:hypothetical protein
MIFDLSDPAFLAACQPASGGGGGLTLLGTVFSDFGNTTSPGVSPSASLEIPSGTTAIIIGVLSKVDSPNGITTCTVGGSSAAQLAISGHTSFYAIAAAVFGIVGTFSGPTTFQLGTKGSATGAVHAVVWCFSGADGSISNWRGAANGTTGNYTSKSVSITPASADGLLMAHCGRAVTNTVTQITYSANIDLTSYDESPANSSSGSSLASSWGSKANAVATAVTVTGTSDAPSSYMGILSAWIPPA